MHCSFKQANWQKPSILLIHGGTRPQAAFDASPSGQSLQWLLQDPRFVRQYVQIKTPLSATEIQQTLLTAAQDALLRHQINTVVWLRDDVMVSDFFLADRVLELPARGSWQLHAKDGTPFCTVIKSAEGSSSQNGPELLWSIAPEHADPIQITAPKTSPELLIVSASRVSPSQFYESTALGRSVQRLRRHGVKLRLHVRCDNKDPLASAYNQAITPDRANAIVIFAHDDIELHDWHLSERLDQALQRFDVIGVAGNRYDRAGQPGWAFPNRKGTWAPSSELLGCIGHDTLQHSGPGRKMRILSRYGRPCGDAALLDGVFLAVRMQQLLQSGCRFDPALPFHYYDLDFCRQARLLDLKLGVWPIAITHMSGGNYDDASWSDIGKHYHAKWNNLTIAPPTVHPLNHP
jgi:hypothetical protein